MSRRRKSSTNYVEVSDSDDDDDDFLKSSAAESAVVRGWSESRLKRQKLSRRSEVVPAPTTNHINEAINLCDDDEEVLDGNLDHALKNKDPVTERTGTSENSGTASEEGK